MRDNWNNQNRANFQPAYDRQESALKLIVAPEHSISLPIFDSFSTFETGPVTHPSLMLVASPKSPGSQSLHQPKPTGSNDSATESIQPLIQKLDATLETMNERLNAMDANQSRLIDAINLLNNSLTPLAKRRTEEADPDLTEEELSALEPLVDTLYATFQRWDRQADEMNRNLDALLAELREPLTPAIPKE